MTFPEKEFPDFIKIVKENGHFGATFEATSLF